MWALRTSKNSYPLYPQSEREFPAVDIFNFVITYPAAPLFGKCPPQRAFALPAPKPGAKVIHFIHVIRNGILPFSTVGLAIYNPF